MTQADVCEEKRGFAGRNPLAELIQLTPTGPSSAAPQSLAGAVCSGSLEVIELKPLKLGKRFPCALCNSECSWRACWAEDCPYCARTDPWERLQKFFWSDAIAIFSSMARHLTSRSVPGGNSAYAQKATLVSLVSISQRTPNFVLYLVPQIGQYQRCPVASGRS